MRANIVRREGGRPVMVKKPPFELAQEARRLRRIGWARGEAWREAWRRVDQGGCYYPVCPGACLTCPNLNAYDVYVAEIIADIKARRVV
jgi:hypothetical protein